MHVHIITELFQKTELTEYLMLSKHKDALASGSACLFPQNRIAHQSILARDLIMTKFTVRPRHLCQGSEQLVCCYAAVCLLFIVTKASYARTIRAATGPRVALQRSNQLRVAEQLCTLGTFCNMLLPVIRSCLLVAVLLLAVTKAVNGIL